LPARRDSLCRARYAIFAGRRTRLWILLRSAAGRLDGAALAAASDAQTVDLAALSLAAVLYVSYTGVTLVALVSLFVLAVQPHASHAGF